MESANDPDHHQQQDNQFLVDSSCYELSCYQNHILNGARNITTSRDVNQHLYHNIDLVPISQDLRLPSISIENFNAHDLQHLARLKHELAVTGSYSDLPDIISSSPTTSAEEFMSNNDNNQDMLLKSDSNGWYRGSYSQILPTLNISTLKQPTSTFNINLPALDSFGPTTLNGSSSYQLSTFNAPNIGSLFNDNCLSYGVDQMLQIFEPTEAKKPASDYRDAKVHKASSTKKSKLELGFSSTPLKVRKEKLGDRISALQQMVAPFGKTDTASVLTEAIGYIKFLQNQLEGLIKDGNKEMKSDLRSRGLCLVPISCLTYVSYVGGSIWATQ